MYVFNFKATYVILGLANSYRMYVENSKFFYTIRINNHDIESKVTLNLYHKVQTDFNF